MGLQEGIYMDYDALNRLVKLRDSGAITEEEFASQKAVLLETGEAEAEEAQKGSFKTRAMAFLGRAEGVYLAVLRGATLVFATILVVYAAWLGLSGLYNVSRNASAVKEEAVAVSADEVATAGRGAPAADAMAAHLPRRSRLSRSHESPNHGRRSRCHRQGNC